LKIHSAETINGVVLLKPVGSSIDATGLSARLGCIAYLRFCDKCSRVVLIEN